MGAQGGACWVLVSQGFEGEGSCWAPLVACSGRGRDSRWRRPVWMRKSKGADPNVCLPLPEIFINHSLVLGKIQRFTTSALTWTALWPGGREGAQGTGGLGQGWNPPAWSCLPAACKSQRRWPLSCCCRAWCIGDQHESHAAYHPAFPPGVEPPGCTLRRAGVCWALWEPASRLLLPLGVRERVDARTPGERWDPGTGQRERRGEWQSKEGQGLTDPSEMGSGLPLQQVR